MTCSAGAWRRAQRGGVARVAVDKDAPGAEDITTKMIRLYQLFELYLGEWGDTSKKRSIERGEALGQVERVWDWLDKSEGRGEREQDTATSIDTQAYRRTHCNHTAEDYLEVFSTDDRGLDWISTHNFLTFLQKLSSYAFGLLKVSELAACLEKSLFSCTSGHVEIF
ncbi:hypothetical protein Tco_0387246 [Tanacetum coccineum]